MRVVRFQRLMAVMVAAIVSCLSIGVGPVHAAPVSSLAPLPAEGPGYGGTADALSVEWVDPPDAAGAAGADQPQPLLAGFLPETRGGRDGDRQVDTSYVDGSLRISGIGFRAYSDVTVRIASGEDEITRADASGTLGVTIDQVEIGRFTPGLSVVAIGRAPSGTQRTLVGSVPPAPGGKSPSSLLLGAVLVGFLLLQTRRVAKGLRRRRVASRA
ncbi:MAG: hypothetical protein ACOYEV_02425 [Candidatus Nanopelagicales bacterium]